MQYKLKDYHFGQKLSFSTFGDPCFVERERRWTVSWRPVSAPLPVRNCFKTKSRDVFRVTVCLFSLQSKTRFPLTKNKGSCSFNNVLHKSTKLLFEVRTSSTNVQFVCVLSFIFQPFAPLEARAVGLRSLYRTSEQNVFHSGDAYSVVH